MINILCSLYLQLHLELRSSSSLHQLSDEIRTDIGQPPKICPDLSRHFLLNSFKFSWPAVQKVYLQYLFLFAIIVGGDMIIFEKMAN